jgi:hypothetical protein
MLGVKITSDIFVESIEITETRLAHISVVCSFSPVAKLFPTMSGK